MWICAQGVERWWSIRYEIPPKRRCRGRVFEGDFAIREDLRTVVLLVMREKDWIDFNKATHCHICKKSLVKESFLDPFTFCERDESSYCGKAHKKMSLQGKIHWAKKQASTIGWRRQMDKKQPRRLLYYLEPLKLRNYRDAAKDLFHLPGKYRKTTHNACNINLRIRPEQDPLPVVFHSLKGNDAILLFQAMAKVEGIKIKCIHGWVGAL